MNIFSRALFSTVLLCTILFIIPRLSFSQTVATQKNSEQVILEQAIKSTQPTKDEAVKDQILQQRFKDWNYRCVVSKEGNGASGKPAFKQNCEISQSVEIEQEGKRVVVLNLAVSRAQDKAKKVNWALVALAPLDIHLPSDFGLVIGKRKPLLTKYRNCNHLGCWAVIAANNSVINGLKKAHEGAGLFRLLNGKVVRVVFSLKGFTKAFGALEKNVLPKVEVSQKATELPTTVKNDVSQ